jgi:hypothetical protein
MDTEYTLNYYKPDDEFLEELTFVMSRVNMGDNKGIHLGFLKNTPQINLDIDIENGN